MSIYAYLFETMILILVWFATIPRIIPLISHDFRVSSEITFKFYTWFTMKKRSALAWNTSEAPNENIVQNHLNIALLNVF